MGLPIAVIARPNVKTMKPTIDYNWVASIGAVWYNTNNSVHRTQIGGASKKPHSVFPHELQLYGDVFSFSMLTGLLRYF